MRKLMALVAVAALLPAVALAQVNNVGSCGWGSKLFDGQKGIVPQGAAGLTNALFFNQTFGVSFGTSGCTQDGAADRAAFDRVARDNMKRIFPIDNAATDQILSELRQVLSADAQLARYSAAL